MFIGASQVQAGLVDHVVINEVSVDSVVGAGGTDDDWVELYNPTNAAVSLVGMSIQKTSGTGGSPFKAALSGTIPAKGYFLIVRNGSATAQALKDKADALVSNSFSLSAGNIVYLASDNVNVDTATLANVIDYVGFGDALFHEGGAAAPEVSEAKSIARVPDGEDTDQNSVDFQVLNTPTPQNSQTIGDDDDFGGTVLLTVTPDENPVENIGSKKADIIFQVNTVGTAYVRYGLTGAYGSSTSGLEFTANTDNTISLSGLECDTTYHYAIYAENESGSENDTSADATFSTLPCGMALNSLTMTKTSAKANNNYANGWEWNFDITVRDLSENTLKMKFDAWSGAATLSAGGNMQFSVDGSIWIDITSNGAYPSLGADISGIDESTEVGRQVNVVVRMKVPAGTLAGFYSSGYGILTE